MRRTTPPPPRWTDNQCRAPTPCTTHVSRMRPHRRHWGHGPTAVCSWIPSRQPLRIPASSSTGRPGISRITPRMPTVAGISGVQSRLIVWSGMMPCHPRAFARSFPRAERRSTARRRSMWPRTHDCRRRMFRCPRNTGCMHSTTGRCDPIPCPLTCGQHGHAPTRHSSGWCTSGIHR